MQPAVRSLTKTATWPVAQVLRQLLATQWWLAAAAVIVVASGCGARLGYVADELVLQNDNGWATAAMLLSIPLLGALHVACVQELARPIQASGQIDSARAQSIPERIGPGAIQR